MNTRLQMVQPWIVAKDFDKAAKFCALNKDDDLINLISMCDVMLPGNLIVPTFDEYANTSLIKTRLQKYVTDDDELLTELSTICSAFFAAASKGQPGPSLPAFIMQGLEYEHAYVDFADAAQMKKVGDYIGGWKTIGPAQGQPVEMPEAVPA